MRLHLGSRRLHWIILALALILALAASAAVSHRDVRALQQDHSALAQSLSKQLARSAHLALLADNQNELTEIARTVLDTDPVLGRVIIERTGGGDVITVSAGRQAVTRLDGFAARSVRALVQEQLATQFATQIPPVGEGSLLDPFGTPRAGIGMAVLQLSESQYTLELAQIFYNGLILWLLLFAVLATTGYGIAWVASLPLLRLGNRLNALTADDSSASADRGYEAIERNLTALGQRLSRSEVEAREATEALHGQSRQLEAARAHARNAARMRADLVAGMSHELRAPLTAILSHGDLLARSSLDKRQKDYVSTVRRSARNLLSLIDDVLEWSSIEAGKPNLNEVGFNLADSVEDTIGLLAPLAYEKDLELAPIIYQDVPVRLRGDPQRFQQILTNLLSNAIKFTDNGGVTVRIMLEEETDDSVEIRVSVSDTGPGISPEAQSRLFDMYDRLENRTTPGSGLGLPISRRLLKLMGGDISVQSELGRGSEFEFVLPLKKARHGEQHSVPWSQLEGKRVWLQDDYATARLALAHHLESWKIKVFEMDTRYDLQACLEDDDAALRPDLAIIGMRGEQAHQRDLHALLNACHAAGLPVLTLVTSIDPDTHARLEQAGASLSIAKSITRLQLYQSLCQLAGISLSPSSTSMGPPLADVNVLIADNSPAARGYLATLLTQLGAGVAQAGDGKEALAAWRKGNFPVVLLDEQMPGLSGSETARRIREMATDKNQPLLIGVTADSRATVAQRLLAAGMDACLVKPFDEQRLLRCIEPLLAAPLNESFADVQPGIRVDSLTADPQLAELLKRELPEQFNAVQNALSQDDHSRALAEIHTLHGSAAFYGLSALQAQAKAVEHRLQQGQTVTADDIQSLEQVVFDAVASIQTDADKSAR